MKEGLRYHMVSSLQEWHMLAAAVIAVSTAQSPASIAVMAAEAASHDSQLHCQILNLLRAPLNMQGGMYLAASAGILVLLLCRCCLCCYALACMFATMPGLSLYV